MPKLKIEKDSPRLFHKYYNLLFFISHLVPFKRGLFYSFS